jgi:hypothetical protein
MRELRDVLATELAVLEGIAGQWAATDPTYPDLPDRDDFYAQLTLDLGLNKLGTKLAWADRCISRIEQRLTEDRHADVA